jgi:hypothetical protein
VPKRTAGGRGQTLDSRYAPQLFLAVYPLQAKRRIHYNTGHRYLSTLLQAACMPSDARDARRAGTLSAIVVLIGETAGLHTCQAGNPFECTGWILFHPCFLTDPLIFAETFFIASRQGGID